MNHEELWLKYRHDCNRKCQWDEIDGTVAVVSEEDARAMPIFRTEDIGMEESPMCDGLPDGTLICILVHEGRGYLVNTEGFHYARYITRLQIVKSIEVVDVLDLLK